VVPDPDAMVSAAEGFLAQPVPPSSSIGITMDDTLAAYDRIFDQPQPSKP